jgi:hypothetical protein
MITAREPRKISPSSLSRFHCSPVPERSPASASTSEARGSVLKLASVAIALARGSRVAQADLRVCAEVCRRCAENCERVGEMDECGEACKSCAESCQKMAP